MTNIISISHVEYMMAAVVGIERNASAIHRGWKLEQGRKDLGIERDIIGAIGELAVARYMGTQWTPVTNALDNMTGDVDGYQVRTVTNPAGSLIVKRTDDDLHRYILAVIGRDTERKSLTVRIAGWMQGKDAKMREYFRDVDPAKGIHAAAWFVPQARLRVMG